METELVASLSGRVNALRDKFKEGNAQILTTEQKIAYDAYFNKKTRNMEKRNRLQQARYLGTDLVLRDQLYRQQEERKLMLLEKEKKTQAMYHSYDFGKSFLMNNNKMLNALYIRDKNQHIPRSAGPTGTTKPKMYPYAYLGDMTARGLQPVHYSKGIKKQYDIEEAPKRSTPVSEQSSERDIEQEQKEAPMSERIENDTMDTTEKDVEDETNEVPVKEEKHDTTNSLANDIMNVKEPIPKEIEKPATRHKPVYVPSVVEQHAMKLRQEREKERKMQTRVFKYSYVPNCLDQHAMRLKKQRDMDMTDKLSLAKHSCTLSRADEEAMKLSRERRMESQKQSETSKEYANFSTMYVNESKIASLPGWSSRTDDSKFRNDLASVSSALSYSDMIHFQMKERTLRLREIEKKTRDELSSVASSVSMLDLFVAKQKEDILKERSKQQEVKSYAMSHPGLPSPADDFVIKSAKAAAYDRERQQKLLQEEYTRNGYLASAQWNQTDFGFTNEDVSDCQDVLIEDLLQLTRDEDAGGNDTTPGTPTEPTPTDAI